MSLGTGYHYSRKSAHTLDLGKSDTAVPLVVEYLPITECTLTKTAQVIMKFGNRETAGVVLVDTNDLRVKYQRGYCMLISPG
jgi:hypothetical protein